MTRRAKERRQERVQEKHQATEKRLQRERLLSLRPEWRALLLRVDGADDDAQAVVSPRHQLTSKTNKPVATTATSSTNTAAVAATILPPTATAIAENIQWKSTHVPIAAASVFQLPIKVDAPHATVQYTFTTKDFDISFGIQLLTADSGAMRELSAVQRYDSHMQSIHGTLELPGPAMVVLVWDNSFSWINAKQLAYQVALHQKFPDVGISPDSAATPEQRAALALHERAKREMFRVRRELLQENLQATIVGHDQQLQLLRFQIEELQHKLETTETLKQTTIQEQQGVEEEIEALSWEIDALLWRSMGTTAIHQLFAFSSERDLTAWSLTSHQWHERVRRFRPSTSTELLVPRGDDETKALEYVTEDRYGP